MEITKHNTKTKSNICRIKPDKLTIRRRKGHNTQGKNNHNNINVYIQEAYNKNKMLEEYKTIVITVITRASETISK
jgi:hypothetical protein